MARYEHLPIYKKAYDLTLYFEKLVRNFGRYHKYGLGEDLRRLSRRVVQNIRQANDAHDKTLLLLQNRNTLEELKLTIRLCRDLKAFPNANSYQHSVNLVIEIIRQNEGWLGTAMKKEKPESLMTGPPA